MPKIKARSVSTQLMRIVFSLYCLVAIVVTSIHIVEEYNHTQNAIREELKSCETIFGDILGRAMWYLDKEQIKNTMKSVLELPVVVGITIYGEEGNVINQLGSLPSIEDSSTTEMISYRFPVNYQYQENSIKIGDAVVYSSDSIILDRIEVGFAFLVINAFIKGIALWVIFLYISKRLLAKPLNQLTKEIETIKFDTLHPLKIAKPKEKPNEIDVLSKSFSDMVDELIDSKKAIIEFNHTLENQVKERTQDLLVSKQVAESALKVKSEFLATMSHEIRTPMNGVLGMLNLLAKTKMDKKQLDYLDMAQSSAESLLVIINDILDFSKIEAGKVDIEKTPFEIFPLIHSLMHVMVVKAANKNIDLILNTKDLKHGSLIGDPHRIRQIITNITDNAIKFTGQGQVVVSIASIGSEQDPSTILFQCRIQDSGIGIPKEKLNRLFENFNQVDSSTTRRYGGTGLGLAISKRLAELMGGKIEVTSQEQEGSTFTLSIPMNLSPWAGITSPSLKDKSVALIFSNEIQIDALSDPLSSLGSNLLLKNTLLELTTVLQKQHMGHIDYLVLEIKDSQSGIEYIETILGDSHFTKSHIILTCLPDIELPDLLLQKANITQILLSPVSHLDILQAIWQLQNPEPTVEKTSQIQPSNQTNQLHMNILIAEDNIINQQIVIELLEDFGHSVQVAENGEAVLQMLAEENQHYPFNLILMDCHMPIMDGYEATRMIRKGQRIAQSYQAIPIIAMTANSMEGDREKCLAAGMTDYLSKPIVQNDLFDLIKRYSSEANSESLKRF